MSLENSQVGRRNNVIARSAVHPWTFLIYFQSLSALSKNPPTLFVGESTDCQSDFHEKQIYANKIIHVELDRGVCGILRHNWTHENNPFTGTAIWLYETKALEFYTIPNVPRGKIYICNTNYHSPKYSETFMLSLLFNPFGSAEKINLLLHFLFLEISLNLHDLENLPRSSSGNGYTEMGENKYHS